MSLTQAEDNVSNNEDNPDLSDETQSISACILLFLGLMVVNSIILNFIKKLKGKYLFFAKYVQDAAVTTTIGLLAGLILSLIKSQAILDTIKVGYQDLFMIVLLPPIIFDSAINMHKKSFFNQLGSITIYAVFGTIIAAIITAGGLWSLGKLGVFSMPFNLIESAAFGSLISATDPVTVLAIFGEMNADRVLYALIFGESILNDAVTIVMYKIVGQAAISSSAFNIWISIADFIFLFSGSILLGYLVGIICAWVLKVNFANVEYSSRQENTETSMMLLVPWVSYLLGEGFGLSGIVCIMFCGISMAKYALPNLSEPGKKLTKRLYSTLGSSFENLVFLFIGMGFFSFPNDYKGIGANMILGSMLIITLSRYIQIKILTTIINKFRSKSKITSSFEFLMFYSGFRGAMAFALSINASQSYTNNNSGSAMLTLTLIYTSLTIYGFGTFLIPILQVFNVQEKDFEPTTRNYLNKIKGCFGYLDYRLNQVLVKENDNTVDEDEENYKMHKLRLLELKTKPSQINGNSRGDATDSTRNNDNLQKASPAGLTDSQLSEDIRNPME